MSEKEKKNLKQILRNYNRMDRQTRRRLNAMGIQVADSKNHYHLVYNGKHYIIAKTPSDHRAGMNVAAIICRDAARESACAR